MEDVGAQRESLVRGTAGNVGPGRRAPSKSDSPGLGRGRAMSAMNLATPDAGREH